LFLERRTPLVPPGLGRAPRRTLPWHDSPDEGVRGSMLGAMNLRYID
jgi:hypothetical protein